MPKRYVLSSAAADWLRSLRASAPAVAPRRLEPAAAYAPFAFPHPFEVRFATSAATGGAFIIWLPDASILAFDNASVSPFASLTAAPAPYPAGWYILQGVQKQTCTVYLVITPPATSSGAATAAYSTVPSASANDFSIPLAFITVDATTGAVAVKQAVTSALRIMSGAPSTPVDISDLDGVSLLSDLWLDSTGYLNLKYADFVVANGVLSVSYSTYTTQTVNISSL